MEDGKMRLAQMDSGPKRYIAADSVPSINKRGTNLWPLQDDCADGGGFWTVLSLHSSHFRLGRRFYSRRGVDDESRSTSSSAQRQRYLSSCLRAICYYILGQLSHMRNHIIHQLHE